MVRRCFAGRVVGIKHTAGPDDEFACRHLADALGVAIRIGHDSDTVAAIAGSLLGARWGMSAIRAEWRCTLHGWPGLTAKGLEKLAFLAAQGGATGKYGWPKVDHIAHAPLQYGKPVLVRHPHDDGVWLASATALDALPDEVDAVVSLCLTGTRQVPAYVDHIGFRIMDEPGPDENPNLDYVLVDAARTVATLRAEGKSVLIHCVASHSRTPTVGIAYSMLRGIPLAKALPEVCGVLPVAHPNSGFRLALSRVEPLLM